MSSEGPLELIADGSGGGKLDTLLPFKAQGVYVQNFTAAFVHVDDAGFFPPNSSGSSPVLLKNRARAAFEAPPGAIQPIAPAKQTCFITYVDYPVPWSAGPVQGSQLAAVTQVERVTKASLPAPGNPGRLVMLTDYDRGLWKDTGTQFVSVEGEVFNLKQFGAKGDNIADDTAAMTAWALAASNAGGTAYAPPGIYRFVGPITWTVGPNAAGILVRGAGRQQTIFRNTANTDGFLSDDNAHVEQFIAFEDFTIDSTVVHTVGDALRIIGSSPGIGGAKTAFAALRLYLRQHFNGLVLLNGVNMGAAFVVCGNNAQDGLQVAGAAPSTTTSFFEVYCTGNGRRGVFVTGLISGAFVNVISELSGADNWYFLGGGDILLNAPYSEAAAVGFDHMVLDSVLRMTIVSPRFSGSSGRNGLTLSLAGGTRPNDIVVIGGAIGGLTGYGIDVSGGAAPVTIIGTVVGTGATGRINDPSGVVNFLSDDSIVNMMLNVWTPIAGLTVTQVGAVAATIDYARYTRLGKTIHLQLHLTATAVGAAAAIVVGGLPAVLAPLQTGARRICGHGLYFRTGVALWTVEVEATTANTFQMYRNADGGPLGGAGGGAFAIAIGDEIVFDLTYELA